MSEERANGLDVQRVVDEKTELDEKRDALSQWICCGDVFDGLPGAERERLFRQGIVMRDYSVVLGERIAASRAKQ